MILVTGVTGNLGKATAEFLLKKVPASTVAVLARNPEKAASFKAAGADVRQGDYNDIESLKAAFKGVDKVFLVSSNDIPNRVQQHTNAIEAAKAAGVKQVIYTSFQREDETDASPIAFIASAHLATEKILKESGLAYTILKNGLYTEGLDLFISDYSVQSGVVSVPAGDSKAAFISISNLGEASANILTAEGTENKVYEFGNSKAYSFAEIAEFLSEVVGKPIAYVSPDPEVHKAALVAAGVPDMYVGMISSFAKAVKVGEFNTGKSDIAAVLGREPDSPKVHLNKKFGLKEATAMVE
ncbi:MAG: SDR family oxidoreductase [Bacteroidota bacterium]